MHETEQNSNSDISYVHTIASVVGIAMEVRSSTTIASTLP